MTWHVTSMTCDDMACDQHAQRLFAQGVAGYDCAYHLSLRATEPCSVCSTMVDDHCKVLCFITVGLQALLQQRLH
jgi:hypothetical protein